MDDFHQYNLIVSTEIQPCYHRIVMHLLIKDLFYLLIVNIELEKQSVSRVEWNEKVTWHQRIWKSVEVLNVADDIGEKHFKFDKAMIDLFNCFIKHKCSYIFFISTLTFWLLWKQNVDNGPFEYSGDNLCYLHHMLYFWVFLDQSWCHNLSLQQVCFI